MAGHGSSNYGDRVAPAKGRSHEEVMALATEEYTETVEEQSAAVQADTPKMWKWSVGVHVGEGADECAAEHEDDTGKWVGPACENEGHFHAWCRLPNPYEERDIREKALAAKARRIRELHDQDSDAFVILDQEIMVLATDDQKAMMIEELASATWGQDYSEAVEEVNAEERFAGLEHDKQELLRLLEKPDADREQDQVDQIERHIDSYIQAIQESVEAKKKPRREALEQLGVEALGNQVRQHRTEQASTESFNHMHATWTIFVGTRYPWAHQTRVFSKLDDLTENAEEVVEALREVFGTLRLAAQAGAAGNS